METLQFADFKELSAIAGNLDVCSREASFFRNPKNGSFENDPKRRDILNMNTLKRAAVVSDIYHEYQHKDVVTRVVDTMTKAQLKGHGRVYDYGDAIKLEILFDGIALIKDPTGKGKDIQPGVIFRNSYNKANSVTGSGYFLRLVCTNGMTMRQMIPEMRFSERHTLSIIEKLPSAIDDFVTGLLSRSKVIETTIDIASKVQVQFSTREQRLQTIAALVEHTKLSELIDAQITTLNPTKWDIYNGITQVLSHERVGETVKERIEKVSEKVLSPAYTIIPAVLA